MVVQDQAIQSSGNWTLYCVFVGFLPFSAGLDGNIFLPKNMELWTLNISDNTYLQHWIEKISTVNGCAAY